MRVETIIVGAGMAGLCAGAKLAQHGHKALVLEARSRIGGRIHALEIGGQAYELGPSWVWPGQPHVAAALKAYGIASFPQYSKGTLLYQQADGRLDRHETLSPMANALRIDGGPSALINAFAASLAPDQIQRGCALKGVAHQGDYIEIAVETETKTTHFKTKNLALAMPPRLCAGLEVSPPLSDKMMAFATNTPTWMAGHAKFTAVYKTPFWREAGLSGDAMSRRGPMAEIHDISPPDTGPYALFGFIGLDANTRQQVGTQRLREAALQQLADIFGPAARSPIEAKLQDWSQEAFTATQADKAPLRHHPAYGLYAKPDAPWTDQLHFIASETATENGGLIEGALQRGIMFAEHVIALEAGRPEASNSKDGHPRKASMSWDWLTQQQS